MFETGYFKILEKKIIEDNETTINREFLKLHYSKIITLIDPIIIDHKLILDEFKDKLLNHLFFLAFGIEYVPSIFVKKIAEISSYIHTLEYKGVLNDLLSFKSTEFLTNYYKTISIIVKNKYVDPGKKKVFEKIVSQKLSENTVEWLLKTFSETNKIVDNKAKIMLKAITQTKFEFFGTFAFNFKKAIFDLVNSNSEKNYLNKYIFKIIEKCLSRLHNIENDILLKLNKISQNIIDLYLKTNNNKIKKLFRSALRIKYIIYDKNSESNSKIIKFFTLRFTQLLEKNDSIVPLKFKEKILRDFVEMNFKILQKKIDLLDYYNFFYSLMINENEILKKEDYTRFYNSFLDCIEKLFKYEINLSLRNQIYEMMYIKLLHNVFNMFYSDTNISNEKMRISIEILCRIISNSGINTKINIIEEISFSHISFFSENDNCRLLELLIKSIMDSVQKSDKIFDYYCKFLEILFSHCKKKQFGVSEFLKYMFFLLDKIDNLKLLKLVLKFSARFLNNFDEDTISMISKDPSLFKEVIGFLELLAKTSSDLHKLSIDKEIMQEILNVYSLLIIIKIFNIPNVNFSKDQIIHFNENEDISVFVFYLLIFALNIPPLLFSRNTPITNTVKVELKISIFSFLSEKTKYKLLSNEFDDFGEKTKKMIRDQDLNSQLYLLGIYISLVAKIVFFRIFCEIDKDKKQEKEFLRKRLSEEKILTEKISIINLLKYLTDNVFLYDQTMQELFIHIFERFLKKYTIILCKYYNTEFKQILLSNDLRNLLNYCCFYHDSVRKIALQLIKVYSNDFPFLLNEYMIFEYYVNILGMLISSTLQPYDYFIKKISTENNEFLELPSEQEIKEIIYTKLYSIFETCLQKSHIINNNNIAYNIANYVNRCTLLYQGFDQQALNYSINILQKIYNNIKKIEISSFLKTTAYLDPIKFEEYLKKNVYDNFDKYLCISAVQDLHNFTDYAKSTVQQIRNKYMGIIEGKINNLKLNYTHDLFFSQYQELYFKNQSKELILNDYCYYKIMNDFMKKTYFNFKENYSNEKLNSEMFSIMVELTSFIIFAKINEFKTTFSKSILDDEIINIITCIPIFMASSKSFEGGIFCWEWILYFNKKLIPLLLSNIILSIKCLKNYIKIKKNFFVYNEINTSSEIFDVEDNFESNRQKKMKEVEGTLLEELKGDRMFQFTDFQINSEKLINLIYDSFGKNIEPNDYITSHIALINFLKECTNEFCKCDLEKLVLIFEILKQYVDLIIDDKMYIQPNYIYLHFLIFNLSLEIIKIFEDNSVLFKFKLEEVNEFKCLLYLFGFRYFEFDKQRRIITQKVILGEIEQTLINCVEMIATDRSKKDNFNFPFNFKKNNKIKKSSTFVTSIEVKQKELAVSSFILYDNIKNLLIYLIESEISNLRYWNSPSTFHIQNKKFIPTSTKLKEERVKEIFETAFSISNKLSIKLVQRYPWIEKKFRSYIMKLGEEINRNRGLYFNQAMALKYMIIYITEKKKNELNEISVMKDFLFWKYPSLNYALKYISLGFDKMNGLHRFAILMLENAKKSAILFYMSELIQSLRTNTNRLVEKFILKISKSSTMIAHQFLWSLEVEEIVGPNVKERFLPKDVIDQVYLIARHLRESIIHNFSPMERRFWFDVSLEFSKMTEISGKFLHLDENPNLDLKMESVEKSNFVRKELDKLHKKNLKHIYLPTNPDTKILEMIPSSALSLQSAKKVPFLVSFIAQNYKGPDSDDLVQGINFSQFSFNEIEAFEHSNNSNQFVNHMNSLGDKHFKSTNNTNIVSYIHQREEDKSSSESDYLNTNLIKNEDDPIFYDEQENNQDILVPHLKIRLFNENHNSRIESQEKSMIEEENFEVNLHDLSNCTADFEEKEEIKPIKTYKKNLEHVNVRSNALKKNYENKKFKINCIFKVGDDLRQDSLALQIIQIFKEIFHSNNLKLFVFPYKTISTITSKHKDLGGLIECIPDCDSRDQIGKTFDTNLYDYFICTFGQENSNEFRNARQNFIESLAAYCVISYILQIKDRHNGNIMVDKHGHIIHIDFGFIFDISPAKNMRFERAAFKLTKEMIKIMGHSTDAEPYRMFVDLVIRGFLASRDYMDKLLDPVVLMFNSGLECFRENSILNFIDRFRLDMNEDEAALYMTELIKEAENNWRTNVYDWIQNKQNKINY